MRRCATFLLAAVLAGALGGANPAAAQDTGYGEAEYLASCAPCHGVRGRGNGPLAPTLSVAPIDLSLLAERFGGEFPFDYVTALIDGRMMVPGHGPREMPAWGRRYYESDSAEFGPEEGEVVTAARIAEITAYVASLQRSAR